MTDQIAIIFKMNKYINTQKHMLGWNCKAGNLEEDLRLDI